MKTFKKIIAWSILINIIPIIIGIGETLRGKSFLIMYGTVLSVMLFVILLFVIVNWCITLLLD